MNNNGERIKEYNELLISFLNNLVNNIKPTNAIISAQLCDVVINFKKQLEMEGLEISDDGIKTLMCNALNEYIKIIMFHFDNSDIHRIDISHENNVDINSEVSQNTNNLVNAVNQLNKLPEYFNLINSIKNTLMNYFAQTFPEKENISNISERIINSCIVSYFNGLSASKIDEFYANTLPNLIAIGDTIIYIKPITEEDIQAFKEQSNEERDNFIYQTMDVEIKEGFVNGVVTLDVTDSMGNTISYRGREAMDKLLSYNQLFEASRPGRKADISKWEHLLYADNNPVQNPQIQNNNYLEVVTQVPNNIPGQFNTPVENTNINSYGNDLTEVDDLLNRISNNSFSDNSDVNNMTNYSNNNEQVINNFLSNMNNNGNNTLNNTNQFVNDNNSNIQNNKFVFLPEENMKQNINNTSINQPINNEYMDNNSLAGSTFNDMINAVKPIDNVQINNEPTVYQSSRNNLNTNPNFANSNNNFSFIPNFNNPNQERNDFIRKITSTIIEEDVDNNGNLYLKVIEPTGREQVYTGKEAVTMIKNYNRTYLDSNPGKVVDTSLIDRFQ